MILWHPSRFMNTIGRVASWIRKPFLMILLIIVVVSGVILSWQQVGSAQTFFSQRNLRNNPAVEQLLSTPPPSPSPTPDAASEETQDPAEVTEPTPDGVEPSPSPSPELEVPQFDLEQLNESGTDVVVGEIPIFKLQTADYTSDVRARAVGFVIEQFLAFDGQDQLPEPEVRVEQTDNLQYILKLGERDNYTRTSRYLFTVTNADAAAAKEVEQPKIRDVQEVALEWSKELEQAIAAYRQEKLDLLRGRNPLVFLFSVLSSVSILLIAYFSWRLADRALIHLQQGLFRKSGQDWGTWIDIGVTVGRLLTGLAIAATAIHIALSFIPSLRSFQRNLYFQLDRVLDGLIDVLTQPLPNSNLSVSSLLTFIVMTVVVFSVSHNLSQVLKQRFLTRLGLDLGTQEASATIFKYGLTILGVMILLPLSGLNLGSLAVIAGAIGIGFGLGLQNIFNDYISYVAILFERPIQIGDLVEVDNLIGTVERIHPWASVVRTLDRVFVIVPNSRFTSTKVVNWSYRDPRCRIHIPVNVAYGMDENLVREALLAAAKTNPRVLSTPEPQVWLVEFGDSALKFKLLVWINRPQDQFILTSEINFQIVAEFRKRGIVIPFNQQDLHVRTLGPLQDYLQPLIGQRPHQPNGHSYPSSHSSSNDRQEEKVSPSSDSK